MKHTSFPKTSQRRKKVLYLANKRGIAATEWLKENKLNKETEGEFRKLMKSIST